MDLQELTQTFDKLPWTVAAMKELINGKPTLIKYLQFAEQAFDQHLTHATELRMALENEEQTLLALQTTIATLSARIKKNNPNLEK